MSKHINRGVCRQRDRSAEPVLNMPAMPPVQLIERGVMWFRRWRRRRRIRTGLVEAGRRSSEGESPGRENSFGNREHTCKEATLRGGPKRLRP